jgi:SecD/SecF fusion protein
MDRLRWRALTVVIVIAAAAAVAATTDARLGLDLQGGTQIVLEAEDTDRVKVDDDVASRTLEVLRRRVDALGVAEPTLQRSGDRRIIVELPGVADPNEALNAIGRTAQLAFHPVISAHPPGGPEPAPVDNLLLEGESGERLQLGPAAVTGESVSGARAVLAGELSALWQIELDFRGAGDRQWAQLTGQAACAPVADPKRRVAIVLDRDIISSPPVASEVRCGEGITGGRTAITGNFTQSEAKDLALLIRAGALPVPVHVVEQRTVGPTLGEAAIDASVRAALIGAGLTILYMIVYYRLLGVLAALALGAYALVSFAVLLVFKATLTLPGIAGFVLAIGMAVDANVLVFERIKDEHAEGANVRLAGRKGFKRAWTAIVDSNATTILAAILLFFYASGSVRGFGITLTVGVAVSMFTALVVTRVLVDAALRSKRLAAHPGALGLHVGSRFRRWIDERRPNLLRHSPRWLAISVVAVSLAIAGLATKGIDYGLEFSGGRLIEYHTAGRADLNRVRSAIATAGFPRAVVQESGDGNVAIRTQQLTIDEAARVKSAVEDTAGKAEVVRDEFVGPTIGNELRRRAITALGLALAAQLVYLAIRFRWTYGAAAVLAMFHDVAILVGVFAWLGKPADGVFLAALLTVIGYSINDSVVVFDRIRELRGRRPRDRLADVANDACLQTVPRTINTGLGALFILVALYFLGGETLTDFALALLIGILVGTWSSVFTATPLAVLFARDAPIAASGRPTPKKVLVPAGGPARVGDGDDGPALPQPVRPARTTPRPPQPRKRKSQKRR